MEIKQTMDLGFLCASLACSPYLLGQGCPRPLAGLCLGAVLGLVDSRWLLALSSGVRVFSVCLHLQVTPSFRAGWSLLPPGNRGGWGHVWPCPRLQRPTPVPGFPMPQKCPTARSWDWYRTNPEAPVYSCHLLPSPKQAAACGWGMQCKHLQLFFNLCHLDNFSQQP